MAFVIRIARSIDRLLCRVGRACCVSRSDASWRARRDRG
jgi:hypothetical protein